MSTSEELRRVVDKSLINDVMCRYARGIDRRDWGLVRSVFHDDSHNENGEYRGDADGFVEWIASRHAKVESSIHFLGNCLVEFFGEDTALVETYFASGRGASGAKSGDAAEATKEDLSPVSFGRYVDRFERRNGEWRIAKRLLVFEAKFALVVRPDNKNPLYAWATRDASDPVFRARAELMNRSGQTAG